MKQPRFPLVSLLDLREMAKKRAEDALAVAIQARHLAEEQCITAKAKLSAMADEIGGTRFTADAQVRGWRALADQEQTCRNLEGKLREAEQTVDSGREQLVSASRDHELVLNLHGKWKQMWVRAEMRTAEIALDDFVNARIAARKFEEGQNA